MIDGHRGSRCSLRFEVCSPSRQPLRLPLLSLDTLSHSPRRQFPSSSVRSPVHHLYSASTHRPHPHGRIKHGRQSQAEMGESERCGHHEMWQDQAKQPNVVLTRLAVSPGLALLASLARQSLSKDPNFRTLEEKAKSANAVDDDAAGPLPCPPRPCSGGRSFTAAYSALTLQAVRILLLPDHRASGIKRARGQSPPVGFRGLPSSGERRRERRARLPLGVGREEEGVCGGEEVQRALQGPPAQLLQRLRLHRGPVRRRGCHRRRRRRLLHSASEESRFRLVCVGTTTRPNGFCKPFSDSAERSVHAPRHPRRAAAACACCVPGQPRRRVLSSPQQ
ncbi:hypothetical protein U9M48_030960 [Paspalum notatum var. saurae]|uniref:Uncharacterized protein n=1 Tax=Paspalum notatum var. saurae TaxID=547442 RepID=A0AAQ3U1M5_PASNO